MHTASVQYLTEKNVNIAHEMQFPHQVSIQSPTNITRQHSWYGGSLIAANWILTAAHCTTESLNQFNIRMGTINRKDGGIALTAFHSIAHPHFNSTNMNNDIALIKLPVFVVLSEYVNIIRIAHRSHIEVGKHLVGHEAIVSGFGYFKEYDKNVLKWNRVSLIPAIQCAAVYGNDKITAQVLCSVAPKYVDAFQCLGDAGGPLVTVEMGVPIVIGVQSFSSKYGCDVGHPTGYVNVASYLDWINMHSGIVIRD